MECPRQRLEAVARRPEVRFPRLPRCGRPAELDGRRSWLPDERQRDVNPIGCRVVFFTRDRWIAYNARRDGDQFRFPMVVPGGRWSDQRGSWSRVTRHPRNATIVEDARIALSRGGAPIAPWRQLLNDWWRDGRVDGVYRCSTYRAVFRRLPRDDPYSAARPDIQNALQNRGCVR